MALPVSSVVPAPFVLGGCVLLGLACFAQGLADFIDPGKNVDEKYIVARSTNFAADILTVATLVKKADGYRRMAQEMSTSGLLDLETQKNLLSVKYYTLLYPVIALADLVVLNAGTGAPYNGDEIKAGAESLSSLCDQLSSTLPDSDNWQGLAAQGYSGKVNGLQEIIENLIGLDEKLADSAERQSEMINYIRLALGILKDLCLIARFVVEYYYFSLKDFVTGNIFEFRAAAAGLLGIVAIVACAQVYSQKEGDYASSAARDYEELLMQA